MKHIFTLSGNSDRFTKEGFVPKPIIKIDDKYVIQYVLDMYPNISMTDVIFIVNERDNYEYGIVKILETLYPDSKIISIFPHVLGPIYSILSIENFILDNEEYLVTYCDLTQKWDFGDFINTIKTSNCDGCLVTHTGKHPHRIKVANFAHIRNTDELVHEVKEKGYFTHDPFSEYASNGIYYFKTGQLLKYYSRKLIENKECVNGEYYVTLAYNQMIKDGLKIIHYPTSNYVCFGTPTELITFKYWKSVIDKQTSEEDIKFVYNYWKQYHNANT